MVGDRPASDSRSTCAGVVGRWGGVLPRILFIGVTLLVSACDDAPTTAPAPAPAPPPPAPQPPNPPASLRVSAAGEDFVEWNWNAVEGAAGYEVQFRLDGEFTDADDVIDTSGRTVYRREALRAGTSVFLRVRAYAGTGAQRLRSAWTFPAPAMTLAPPPPSAPANLRVSASGEDFVEWRWDAVAGATGYEVQFRLDGEFTDADEVIDTSVQTVYRRGALPAGTSAFLRVRAYAVVGDLRLRSGWTVALPATTLAPPPPDAPGNLRVSDTGENFIEWRWDAVEGAAGYEVQFRLDDEFTEADEVIDTSTRTVYRREGLPAGKSAFLRVRSYAETEGERRRSGWTFALPAMTLAPPRPGLPGNLRVSTTGEDFIEWRWDAVEGADGYEVQFSVDIYFTAADEVIDTAVETVYRRDELPAATSAYLRVRSYRETGDDRLRSGWTYVLPAMTLAPVAPAAPGNLRVSATGEDFIEWSWDPVEEAAGYEVQFSLDLPFTEEDEIIERTAGQVSYRREDLLFRTSGHLRVRAVVQFGLERPVGEWSAEVAGMTDPPGPGIEWERVREGAGLVSARGTKGAGLRGVARNDEGRFVAVGADGTIAWSDDGGVNWKEASETATTDALDGMTWGGGRFIAVGGSATSGTVVVSQDGDHWVVASEVPTDTWLVRVLWGGGRYVAVGHGGTILHSSDGDQWNFTNEAVTADWLGGIAWSGDRFVAVGGPDVFYSNDGDRWKRASDAPDAWMDDVAWGGGRFVAVGAGGAIRHSEDGDRWTDAAMTATDVYLWAISWAGGRFLAVGDDGAIVSSGDGSTWVQERPADDRGLGLRGVANDGERFVVVGANPSGGRGTVLLSDGSEWRRANISETLPLLNPIVHSNGSFVTAGTQGAILLSADARVWQEASGVPSEADLWGLAHNGERWVAVGQGPTFLLSDDADLWREASDAPESGFAGGVFWTGARFVAVGFRFLALSDDGDRWVVSDAPSPRTLFRVAALGSRLVTVGNSGLAFYSDDGGETWTPTSETGTDLPIRGVATGDGRLVAVGWQGTIIHSDDGDRWRVATEIPTGANLRAVVWTGERFVAVGGGGAVVHSDDGDVWEVAAELATPENLVGIAWSGTQLVAVGSNGAIVVSPKRAEE